MKRRVRIVLVVLLLALVGALGLALGTTTGLRWTLQLAAQAGGGELHIGDLDGRLLGPIRVKELKFENSAARVTVRRGHLDWRPRSLFKGLLRVTTVTLDGLEVATKRPAQPDGRPPPSPPQIDLPIRIQLDQLNAAPIRLVRFDAPAPVVIDALGLGARYDGRDVDLDHLQVRQGEVQIEVAGTITPRGTYPLDLRVEWRAVPQRLGELRGSAHLSGSLDRLSIAQDTRGAVQSTLAATVSAVLTDPRWEAELQVRKLDPAAFVPGWPPGSVSARLQTTGGLRAFDVSGSLEAEMEELGGVDGRLEAAVVGSQLTVEVLEASQRATGAALKAHGEWDWGAQPARFRLTGDWQGLVWPFTAKVPQAQSPQGRFAAAGTVDDYRFSLDAGVRGAGLPPAHVKAEGSGGTQAVAVSMLEVRALEGLVEGSGNLRWAPRLAWSGTFEAKGIDPGAAWGEWPGRLRARLHVDGDAAADVPGGSFELQRLEGELRGYPVSAKGSAQWRGRAIEGLSLQVRSGSARLDVGGAVTEEWNLDWRVNAPELGAVLPDVEGGLEVAGSIRGPVAEPRLVASIEARAVQAQGYGVGRLDGTLDIGAAAEAPFQIKVTAQQLAFEARQWRRLQVQGSGVGSDHRLELLAGGPDQHVAIALTGGLVGERHWRGRLTRANLEGPPLGAWHMAAPGALELSRKRAVLGPWCWLQDAARLCIGAEMQDRRWSGELEASGIPLALADPWLPADIGVVGSVGGSARAQLDSDGTLTGRAELATSAGEVRYPLVGERQSLAFGAGTLTARIDSQGLVSQLELPLEQTGDLSARLRLPGWRGRALSASQPLDGRLQATLRDLGVLGPLVPDLKKPAGRAAVQFSLAGTIGQPDLLGSATLREGRADVPALGIGLRDVTLDVQGEPGELRYEGSLTSGEGSLRLSGRSRLDAGGYSTTFDLQGEAFQAADIPEAFVLVSPRLEASIRGRRIDLEGEVTVPRARLAPEQLPEGAVAVSEDVVVVGAEGNGPDGRERPWEVYAKVRLIVGDDVRFDGFGLRGRMAGNLLLIDEPRKLTVGRGELSIEEGTYQAYGQNLMIERGRLVFADSFVDDPGLDVRATRTAESVVAGVRVSGTLQDPRLSLFSEPPMSESEVLAYLLTGRPLGSLSTGEGAQLMSAATALGLFGGESVVTNIVEALGVSEVAVEREGGAETSRLVLGHYLSPRLYVRYAVGIFEQANVLQVRYDLSRHLQLQTETGAEAAGADLFYKIE